jgi:hypothetical protein
MQVQSYEEIVNGGEDATGEFGRNDSVRCQVPNTDCNRLGSTLLSVAGNRGEANRNAVLRAATSKAH